MSLTPRGVSGLKYLSHLTSSVNVSLTPRGVSGLKLASLTAYCLSALSHPARGEWIEISP